MGVHGLWDLLAPVGRRVSVEALMGKTLAIDASIWMIQFMKAMRDDKGEMVRNAHLLGFFRRICKLLYLQTKPVFVFDGGTPALKRRTVIARRRQRENAQAKVRKMAEKLLLNQLKAVKLKELKMELENQRKCNERGTKNKSFETENNLIPGNRSCETLAESSKVGSSKEKGDKIDSEIRKDHKEKGKDILIDSVKYPNSFPNTSDGSGRQLSQIEIDAMLAASLAIDDSRETTTMSPNLHDKSDESESDEEEFVLPVHGKVDPSILASLPPSVQLDLLGQMRERLMAENRQRYQAVKKAPEKFSELQIESYLKTVAFRKEIDEVQKNAAGRVADGVQRSRIASESNREFIFSSNYSGDKRFIAQSAVPSCSNQNNATSVLNSSADHSVLKGKKNLNQRRFLKANRMKAMGIRMTRDIQRNLDMMKEYEIDNLQNKAEGSFQISFDAEENEGFCNEDELFSRLVSGSTNDEILEVSSSDSDWDEGTESVPENHASDVDWEEGASSFPQKIPSKGDLKEDDDLRKAIKESLQDFQISNDKCEIGNGSPENSAKIIISSADNQNFTNWGNSLPENDSEDIKISSDTSNGDLMESLNSVEDKDPEVSFHVQRSGSEEKNQNATPRSFENESVFASTQHKQDIAMSSETQFLTPSPQPDEQSSSKAEPLPSTILRDEEAPTETSSAVDIDGDDYEHKFDYDEELRNVEEEHKIIGEEQRKLERNADSVNSEMFAECQELLQMFGLPYIIAPMEAEAQCAYMETSGDVDGVVTDDSDVFLFGGRNVYKNIFDDRKYVETYLMKDVEKELGLSREKLIRMALLLGSDYTEGVSGVGIVNAIEIVNAFDEEDGLTQFRYWIESPDPNILRTKPRSIKKYSANDSPTTREIFMDKHRNVSKNWHMPPSFPSDVVVSAYTCAQVDKSSKPYSWGKPDVAVLQRLCWEKFGWEKGKSKEVLEPVLAEFNKKEIQMRMEAFYSFNERFAKIRSKRIMKAVKGMAKNDGTVKDGEGKGKGKVSERSKKIENRSDSVGGGFCAEENGINDPISPQLLPMPSLKRKRR